MDHVQKSFDDVTAEFSLARSRDQQELKAAASAAGSAGKVLATLAPLVSAACPVDISEAGLVSHPTVWYRDSERRLKLCGQCPPHGGACAEDETSLRVGKVPTWEGEVLRALPCARWQEHRVRERLRGSGVPRALLNSTFSDFDQPTAGSELSKLPEFVSSLLRHEPGWLVVTGPHGSGKTRLSVATLRSLVTRAPRALLWYADVPSVRAFMKQRYDSDETMGDPFEHARMADVTVIDNLDPQKAGTESWFTERLEAVLRQRFLDERATIVTTRATTEELAKHFRSVTFDEVPVCSLQ